MWTYQLRYVRCGKSGCRCADGLGHGPYWYGYEHRGNRVYTKYFGRRPTSTFEPVPADVDVPQLDPRWRLDGKMTFATALRIFGLSLRPNHATLQARLRTLMMEHHPDRGGNPDIARAIGAAYNLLKQHV